MDQKVERLRSYFGRQLDRDVLIGILEMFNGDVNQAQQFLELQGEAPEDYVDPLSISNRGENIPKGYFDKPSNFIFVEHVVPSKQSKQVIDMKKVFMNESSLLDHLRLQSDQTVYPLYFSVLVLLFHIGVELSHVTKSRILASAWARRDLKLANYLLSLKKHYQLPEVVRAVKILDTPRKIKELEKKINKLMMKNNKKRKIGRLRSQINDLQRDIGNIGQFKLSVSGALSKKIRKWASDFTKEQLEYFALHMPKEPWRELADVVHFNPKDFKVDWFLNVCFGENPPKDSILEQIKPSNVQDVLEMVKKYKVPYSHLRKNIENMSKEVKIEICKYETLDTILWWYEELTSAGSEEIDLIILERLEKGETPTFSYGKLMERMLLFKENNASFYSKLVPIAEQRLKAIQLVLEPPIVVFGDASYSMDVAIRTSTIISSVICALTDATLKFFNVRSFEPQVRPKTVQDVLEITQQIKAMDGTAPACTLWEYYEKKKIVKFFIVVTDEIENDKHQGTFFAQLFYKYFTEVYPAKLIMVSFLDNPQEKGRMVRSLESLGIEPLQFRLDAKRPDLTKLDKLLGLLCAETEYFGKKAEVIAQVYKEKGFDHALQRLEVIEKFEEEIKVETPVEEKIEIESPEKKKEEKKENKEKKDVPDGFICPITQEIMNVPVILIESGHTYEKAAIEEWLSKNDTDPNTGMHLKTKQLAINYALKKSIDEWKSMKNFEK